MKKIPQKIKKLVNNIPEDYWNYRWIKSTIEYDEYDKDGNPTGNKLNDVCYHMFEVYYSNGKPIGWSKQPITFYACNAKDMIQLFAKAIDASREKVLKIQDNKLIELDEYMNVEGIDYEK